MVTFQLPYGRRDLPLTLPDNLDVSWVAPRELPAASAPLAVVAAALDAPMGEVCLADFADARSVVIAINDKTRPVPHQHLLPPLLSRLEALGIPPQAITLLLATGMHAPMRPDEFDAVVPPEILARYTVISHDYQDAAGLVHLGETPYGTPVWINRRFCEADVRIVVGNIEPHQFAGFSGGVKTAAIGLAGKATINANHAMLRDPRARPGELADNPVRADIEALGRMIGVHFALNAVLNGHKEIIAAFAGEPSAVLRAGVPLAKQLYVTPIAAPYDLVIATPGGHPKDINFYQAQKALAHASLAAREGGGVILVAACPEGVGSAHYQDWMTPEVNSYAAVFEKFEQEGFHVGPHKALMIARDAQRLRGVWLVSQLPPMVVKSLLLTPVAGLSQALALALPGLPPGGRIGILPAANATVPQLHSPPK